MSEASEIRAWGREQGMELSDRGPLPDALREAWLARDDAEDEPILVSVPFLGDDPGPVAETNGTAPDTPPVERRPERKPQAPKRKPFFQRKPKETGRPRKRVSIENIITAGWGLGAMAFAQSPKALPMARVLDMQAPVAGMVVEDIITKYGVIDRILQPFARGGEQAEKAVGLLGPPIIVGIMTARPELYPVLRGPLKLSMMTWMEISGPAMEKAQKRAEDWSERFGHVDLDAMIDGLFADVPAPPGSAWGEAVSPQEEENIRKARGE